MSRRAGGLDARVFPIGEATREALQMLADSLTELLPYERAVVDVVDGEELVAIVFSGFDRAYTHDGLEHTPEEMTGTRWPLDALRSVMRDGTAMGRFFFLPHERSGPLAEVGWTTTRDQPPVGADAWHPEDLLLAPLHSRSGDLIGCLSLDAPRDGRRPDGTEQGLLSRWVEYAGRVLEEELERERLAARALLLERTREVHALLAESAAPQTLLTRTHDDLVEAFDADAVVFQTFRQQGWGSGSDFSTTAGSAPGLTPVIGMLEEVVRRAWRQQDVLEYDATGVTTDPAFAAHRGPVEAWLRRNDVGRVLLAPLGAGPEAIGSVLVMRRPGRPGWSPFEREAARELGQDVGEILRASRAHARQQQLARELRELDAYKNHLIATVAHELGAPLSVIADSTARIAGESRPGRREVDAIRRSVRHLASVVDDLLMLSRVGDPDHRPETWPVDLTAVVGRVVALLEPAALSRRQRLTVTSDGPAVVRGEVAELERAVRGLVSNAVTYTPDGGEVAIRVGPAADGVALTVTDTGIGIAPHDRPHIFEEFFRSADPLVLAQPGGGLGLAIVDRIVARHGGTIAVESSVGAGSSFRVLLPLSPVDR